MNEGAKKLVVLQGSFLPPPAGFAIKGMPKPDAEIDILVRLRRRPDGPRVTDLDDEARSPLKKRSRFTRQQYATQFGAADDDIKIVAKYLNSFRIQFQPEQRKLPNESATRLAAFKGRVSDFQNAFGVQLALYA